MAVTYVIPRSLLYEASNALLPAEQVCFVTGCELIKSVYILSQLVRIKATRGATHANPSPASIAQATNRLWSFGQDILAQFHSHPGTGAQATLPSPTDLATARRWENGGTFLGAVFSSDARFVRFFNFQQHSTVIIYGTNYAQHEEYLFELHDYHLPANKEHPSQPDGPAGTPPLVGPSKNGKS